MNLKFTFAKCVSTVETFGAYQMLMYHKRIAKDCVGLRSQFGPLPDTPNGLLCMIITIVFSLFRIRMERLETVANAVDINNLFAHFPFGII